MSRRGRPHHRARRLCALGSAAVVCLWLALVPMVAAADPVAPAVTFSSTGVPPVSCGSRPNVSSLSVTEGTAFLVENRIGESAWLRVGGEAVMELADGAGSLLTIEVGQHEVRLVPGCLVVGDDAAEPVTVTVSPAAGGGPSASSAPPSPSPDPAAPAQGTQPGAPAASDPPAAAPVGPSAAVLPAATAVVVDPTASPALTSPPSGHSVVLAASPVPLRAGGNPKGVRLLAIVATICVLGVTAAVIRSIVRLSP